MKICYAISNYHLADITAQPKIIKSVVERHNTDDYISIVSETNFLDIFNINPDIITSSGYKFTVLIWLINLILRKKHFVILSETPEILNRVWLILSKFCLKRVNRVFVTSEYIKNRLGIDCVVIRIGL